MTNRNSLLSRVTETLDALTQKQPKAGTAPAIILAELSGCRDQLAALTSDLVEADTAERIEGFLASAEPHTGKKRTDRGRAAGSNGDGRGPF